MNLMEKLKNPRNAAIFAGLVGLVLGLFWAWVVQPVEFVDATPSYLRADLQEDYLRMTIDSFMVNNDMALALRRWDDLGPSAYRHLQAVQSNPGAQNPDVILAFAQLIEAQRPPGAQPAPDTGGTGKSSAWYAFIAAAVVVFAIIIYLLYKLFRKGGGEDTAAQVAAKMTKNVQVIDYESAGYDPPMAQFVTSYVIGDDLYDDSFSIEAPNGDFLGECGMGISETIGVGTDAKHVSAFEIWLFDKNDIQTVTKVVMTPHLFKDPSAVQRLSEKGEPILAKPRASVTLETATLRIIATLSDVAFGEGPLPPESFFDHLTVELAVWTKPATEAQIL